MTAVFGAGRADDPTKAETPAAKQPETTPEKPKAEEKSPLDFKMKRIDGTEEHLSKYKGKVVVIVNTASKCGFTEQYAGLQDLYAEHKDDGLVILGFPANNFNSQEPGTNAEIATFCTSAYSITFPMFEKISVKGEDSHPLYKLLASQPAPLGGEPKWNFTKFIIDREGKVVARFDADRAYVRSKRLEPEFIKKVEELVAAKDAVDPKKSEQVGGDGKDK